MKRLLAALCVVALAWGLIHAVGKVIASASASLSGVA